ncbi:cadherin-17 [Bombina bombina]|uniref:cadherin-17 n=1 Tax=Bombina bombina TaxID=8345 RepID=UPI00235AEB7D|nr:cadherin-17 [Bombina bombina]
MWLAIMRNFRVLVIVLSFLHTQVKAQTDGKGPLTNKDFTVLEESPPFAIYQFIKSNPNSETFVVEGETDNVIEISPTNGILRTIQSLDRERKTVYRLQVKTLSSSGSTVEGPYTVNIIVEDINDNQPHFNQSEYQGEVREQFRPGKPFLTVYATDPDDPDTPNAQLSFSILRQIPQPDTFMVFQINNKTGAISTTLNGSVILDVTKLNRYELVVEVSDLAEHSFSDTVKVVITVKENLWKAPPPVSIAENTNEGLPIKITEVRWNDPDIIYVLHQRDKFIRFPFIIDDKGNIYVTEPLDREERQQYIFYAFANNENGRTVARPLEIEVNVLDVNDNSPLCPNAVTVFEVQENEGVGSSIGTLEATDLDQNSLVTYELLDQNPKLPQADMFLIQRHTGTIQLKKPGLNIKDVPMYTLIVELSDDGLPPTNNTICEVSIRVIDQNDQIPIFDISDYGNVTIAEDSPLNTLVMEIQATDTDEPFTGSSAILYQITGGDPQKMFIMETNPVNNTGYLKIAKHLDYELFSEHNLVIEARNPEPLIPGVHYNESSITRIRIFVIDIDEKPHFNQSIYQAQVLENVNIGTKLATIVAIDPEGDSLRFQIKGDKHNWLRIDENSGEIFSNALLDREKESHYEVIVVATERNNPQMSSQVHFKLYLDDVNDNAPRLAKDYSNTFFCNPPSKLESFIIQATDDDTRSGRPFKFSLGGNANVSMDWTISEINFTSARLSMKHINFADKIYEIPVKINDQGRPPMEGTVYVPVIFCTCSSSKTCENKEVGDTSLTSVGMAVGILLGTLAFIAIILTAVFVTMNRKKKKEKKAQGSDAKHPTETVNL